MSPKKPRGDDPAAEPVGGSKTEPDGASKAEPNDGRKLNPEVGLCGACVSVRLVENRRGSVFYRCGLSEEDPRFTKYPPLPVLTCPGFVATDPPRSP